MFIRRRPAVVDRPAPLRAVLRVVWWVMLRVVLVVVGSVSLYAFVNPPITWTMIADRRDHPLAPRQWVVLDDIAPVMRRSVVAAEDANFCLHWGFDMTEIRKVIESGSSRGASTITQQTAKNAFLWQGRNWFRKSAETALTPVIEALWSKRRILEVYLNIAEFGPGVFGIHAASRQFFNTTPDRLTPVQAARLAAVLPGPKTRSVSRATNRSRAIADGAATIARDGRAACFTDG
ncbi:monofunctional biosynthetic peptidoglycan transglycosylase [Paracoccus sp. (in: a-proteobacteria)]|uniref:monofunctional biosynthetic peptidoglycan transglycosylase n=1 Tax=Paracoccus sp. TaxID=267 RepID=UPI0026DF8F7D|nr:monofunctional biosynthetic peptidoglycan transglycosylase [Paracoccus sp. (in: a-proteobacteria)]MDO5647587.1 monofunctional biosynthetic peptidoglycan transglycosylase [Paracoccus sp. (in: a-proteobacteria)]